MIRESIEASERRWSIGAQTLGMAVVVAMLLGAAFGTGIVVISNTYPLVTIAAPVGGVIGGLFGLAVGIPLGVFVAVATGRLTTRSVATGMHVVTLLATLGLAAFYIDHVQVSTRSVLGFGAFFVGFGQLGVAFVVRWYVREWGDRKPRSAGIAVTAFGAWANCLVYGMAFGVVGATIVGAVLGWQQPHLLWIFVGFAAVFGASFGWFLGNLVGIPFAVLVVVADKRSQQLRLAHAMPWLAVAITEPLALFLGLGSAAGTVLFASLDAAFAFFGGRSIARRYLRAEGPKIRELVH
jgi:hypothetical protein